MKVVIGLGCEYLYAIKFDFMAKICNDVGILMEEVTEALPVERELKENVVYPIIYTNNEELKLSWQVRHKLYRYLGKAS
jgi:hypothetical protein